MLPAFPFDPDQAAIGVLSPSGPAHGFPRRTNRAINFLNSKTKRPLLLARHAEDREFMGIAGVVRQSDDLNQLLSDDNVGLVMATTGGYGSIRLASRMNLDLIKKVRKPIVGFSDTTALLLSIHALTGLVTFHGPALLSSFGDPEPHPSTWASLLHAVGAPGARGAVALPGVVDRSYRFWDREDDIPLSYSEVVRPRPLQGGRACGVLIGGNLDTLIALCGTRFMPSLRGAILFWEAAFCSLAKVERDLAALEAAGVFDQIVGMIVGVPFRMDGDDAYVDDAVAEIAIPRSLPTIVGLPIGHTQPIACLPIGVRATVDADSATVEIEESATGTMI